MDRFKNMLMSGKMPLIMSLPVNSPRLAKTAWESGADVVKIHINVTHRASSNAFKSFEEESEAIMQMLDEAQGPMGIVLGGSVRAAEQDLEKAKNAGFDFISLYGQNTSEKMMHCPGISKMIAPDDTWQDWEIKQIEQQGADILEASVMHPESYGERLNLRDVICYRHLAEMVKIPIVVPTQHEIHPDEVGWLKENGVSGIMIGAIVTGQDERGIANAIESFKKEIEKL